MNPALVTCVDCGLRTGRFCDGDEVMGPDGLWSGRPCLAVDTVGAVNAAGQEIPNGQRTPLCSECCRKAYMKLRLYLSFWIQEAWDHAMDSMASEYGSLTLLPG